MAAAFAALVSLQHNLHLIQNHPLHSFSFEKKQIETLGRIVHFFIEFMRGYYDTHGTRKEVTEALEIRIARAAETAEDVIESHVVDQIRSGKTRSKTTSSLFLLDLQKAIDVMEYMACKVFIVYIRREQSGMEVEKQPTYSTAAISSTPLTPNKTSMVGFDDLLLQLLDELTGVSSTRQVIPIIGMGGTGKTTLATNAFQHPLIVERFDVCLWATISQQYSPHNILVELMSHLRKYTSKTVDESASETVDEMGEGLYKSLYGRRYLIVLDDMWSLEAWYDMRFLFPDTNNGSRIVVTTRNLDVANHLAGSSIRMSFLDEGNSWDLFCQKAFAEQCCPPELEEIGKKIVEKCKGLPLAIVVVGGHLKKSSMALDYWENIAHHLNSILNSTEDDEQCLNVLSLSYSYLPAHLKPCFLLIGAFPEDEVIFKQEVVRLWIAEGFIEPIENYRLEVVAEYYLFNLFERNLILTHQLDYNREMYTFKVHDLLRELCLKIAKREEFLDVFDTPTPRVINRERRVLINGKNPEVNHTKKTFDATTRSLICEGDRLPPYEFKLLRTLKKVVASSTSESMFQKVNLRYLHVDLDATTHQTLYYYLPSTISLLWNLQILTITVPTLSTVIAPYEIWEMVQLRHLNVNPICLVDPLPVETSDQASHLVLRNLYSLSEVKNLRLSEEVCKRITYIRELKLLYCDEASSDYSPHNLGNFHQLESLELQFDGNPKWRDFALRLAFPSSIKWLHLSGCGVDWGELTMMVGSLPHLVRLRLYPDSVIGSVWTPVEGKFLHLKFLDIDGCHDLIHWNADKVHFPVLKNLCLRRVSKLEEIPSGIGEIPTLQLIKLVYCSESATISAMRTLVEQEEQGNDYLWVKVVFEGDEETLESFNNKVEEEGLTGTNISVDLRNVKTKSF